MRPASVKSTASPFVKRNTREGKKISIDMEKVEEGSLSNHNYFSAEDRLTLQSLRQQLISAEEDGRHSAARKIRREINRLQEELLAISSTFCRGCLRHLHLCRCQGLREGPSRSTVYRRKKREEANLKKIEQIRLELKARIANA